MTVYANYADSIQPGESAPACSGDASRDLVNCGQTLAPERSQQLELGYRWAVTRRLDLSAAAFRTRRPLAHVDAATRTFELLGAQVNNGLELRARGNASRGLTVVGPCPVPVSRSPCPKPGPANPPFPSAKSGGM